MRGVLAVGGGVARLMGSVLRRWPLILIAAFFISPSGPHLRVVYSYRGPASHPAYISCTYLGSRGFITPSYGVMGDCPLIAWIDAWEVRP
ncbi:MAG: hypothetical protein GC191_13060 [Azospirillum sp.]|nr:hypothetical protein [Azospirillum sp.]